jgi:hypothetical protein
MHEEIRKICRSSVGKLEELKKLRKTWVKRVNRNSSVGIVTSYGLDD